MNRYKISRQAEQDLEDIWTYLAEKDSIAADVVLAQILNKFPMLAQFPATGRKRDDLLTGLRSFPAKPYVMFYTNRADSIEILRVLHQSRDIESEF
jgi:toxin ParE1/3/4